MRYVNCVLVLCFLWISISGLSAQVTVGYRYEKLDESQSKDAVIENWKTVISFERDIPGFMPKVKELDRCRIVPLQNNWVKKVYYSNSHKKISQFKFYTKSGRRNIKPVIGDSESPGIFQGDTKYHNFSKLIKPSDVFGEFQVETLTDDLRFYPKLNISDLQYFTQKREIEIVVPDWLDVDFKFFNTEEIHLECKVDTLKDGTHYHYSIQNLKAPFFSDYFPGVANVNPHMIFIYNRYRDKNNEWHPVLNNAKQLYGWYKELIGKEEYELEEFKSISSEVVKGASTKLDSVQRLFNWVQDKIRYIAFEKGMDGYRPKKAMSVYNNKFGDCKGMSNLLKAMLCSLGFDARLAWLGTNDLPYTYQDATIAADNHMICVLYLNGQKYFLDATEKYLKVGEVACRIDGKEVLIEDNESFEIDTIKRSEEDISCEAYKYELKIKGSDIYGKMSIELMGDEKRSFYHLLSILSKSEQEERLRRFLSHEEIIVDSLSAITLPVNRDEEMNLNASISKRNGIVNIANECYVGIAGLMPDHQINIDTSKMEQLRFSHDHNQINEVLLELPDSVAVSYLPEKVKYEFDDAFFKVSYQSEGNKVKFRSHLYIPYKIYQKNQVKKLMEMLDFEQKTRRQKIVFKTVSI